MYVIGFHFRSVDFYIHFFLSLLNRIDGRSWSVQRTNLSDWIHRTLTKQTDTEHDRRIKSMDHPCLLYAQRWMRLLFFSLSLSLYMCVVVRILSFVPSFSLPLCFMKRIPMMCELFSKCKAYNSGSVLYLHCGMLVNIKWAKRLRKKRRLKIVVDMSRNKLKWFLFRRMRMPR